MADFGIKGTDKPKLTNIQYMKMLPVIGAAFYEKLY